MILPTIRASITREDALHLVELLGRNDQELREAARQRLEDHGVDALLDDPRVRNALLTDPDIRVAPGVVFFVLVRQALIESGVDDVQTADFVASLVLAFGRARAAYRPSDDDATEYFYLVDLIAELRDADARRAFLLRSHLGNYSLWMAGLFPDYLERRHRHRGAPSMSYFDQMGASGYSMAARSDEADALGVRHIFDHVGRDFVRVRFALNRVSERVLWPSGGDPVSRLIRGVERGGS
jgi:hypothetical protein